MEGHYHSFDFIGSSSWPISSFLVHVGALVVFGLGSAILVKAQVNLNAGGNWVPLMEPPDYGHPGQYGASFYYASQLFVGCLFSRFGWVIPLRHWKGT